MSAQPTPSQPVSPVDVAPPVPATEIDASCRIPLLLLFVSAAAWLVVGSLFALIATLKFHKPDFLADCAWLTYGRVHPAHLNAFIYGFAVQAGLGVLLWLFCHLGRTRLAFPTAVILGTKVWNLGVTLGIGGILYGESTGYEWLEMPRYASVMLFFSYLLIGLAALRTFHERRTKEAHLSQWYLFAAVFWFPWIYSTANFLLVAKPVRGVVQAIIGSWYVANFTNIWLGMVGLGVAFYFIPLALNRSMHSRQLGLFGFWMLLCFGSWAAIATGSPLPAWVAAMCTVGGVLLVVPVLSVAWNMQRTIGGNAAAVTATTPMKFITFGIAAYVSGMLLTCATAIPQISLVTHFTWFEPALAQWLLYGFFAMTMFGAIYHILPRLLGAELSSKMVKAHFWLAALGILFYALPLLLGGIQQGFAMNVGTRDFPEVMRLTFMPIRMSTIGDLAMALGHFVLLLNVLGLLVRLTRACVAGMLAGRSGMKEATA
jgi:cytochrome c oxidase cbb3-type subunit 1